MEASRTGKRGAVAASAAAARGLSRPDGLIGRERKRTGTDINPYRVRDYSGGTLMMPPSLQEAGLRFSPQLVSRPSWENGLLGRTLFSSPVPHGGPAAAISFMKAAASRAAAAVLRLRGIINNSGVSRFTRPALGFMFRHSTLHNALRT